MSRRTSIERAFEIAQSGAVANMVELRQHLRVEGYDDIASHLSSGPSLARQLASTIKAAIK